MKGRVNVYLLTRSNCMREIYIISAWPSTEERKLLLIKLIQQLKSLGKEILVASHLPIPHNIINMVDYCIYDRENTIYTDKNLDNYPADFWFENDEIRLEGVELNHSAALSRLFNISLNFVKNLEYDYFVIMESDAEFDIEDLKKINHLKIDLVKNDKKLFFFKLRSQEFAYWEDNGIYELYETLIFGGFLKEFNDRLTFPKNLKEWNDVLHKEKMNHALEVLVTNAFKKYKDDYLILDSVRYFFKKSKTNIFTLSSLDGVYYNAERKNFPILFFRNLSDTDKFYKIYGDIREEIVLSKSHWRWMELDISNRPLKINIDIYEKEKLLKNLTCVIDEKWIELHKNRRIIKFKSD